MMSIIYNCRLLLMKVRGPSAKTAWILTGAMLLVTGWQRAGAQSESRPGTPPQLNKTTRAEGTEFISGKGTTADSANNPKTVKSWAITWPPDSEERRFLDSLHWESHSAGDYILRTGIIYGTWVAAMELVRSGEVVLTEITPPYEYVTIVDPVSGHPLAKTSPIAFDANHDGILKIAFLHQKLDDANFHMYSVYALEKSAPKLIWKSGGQLGDWLRKASDTGRLKTLRIAGFNY